MPTTNIPLGVPEYGGIVANLEPITRLSKDLRTASKTLGLQEVRYLVDLYYQFQDFRIQSAGQIRAITKSEGEEGNEPTGVISWVSDSMRRVESNIKVALDSYTDSEPTGMGEWAKSVCGIGPIISAGLLAHIDISKCPTAGHIWSFAGLNPDSKWEKGKKRPWNAKLKVLCWKMGESFVKVHNNDKDVYGKLYVSRKERENKLNDEKKFTEQAEAGKARVRKSTEAYKWYSKGLLPPGHIHARARRYAVKIFLSHWHEEAYRRHFKCEPPAPYPIAILGHTHKI